MTEDSVGKNTHIYLDPTLAKGKNITLKTANSWFRNSDGSWPDTKVEIQSDYDLAYKTNITNKFRKTSLEIYKIDSVTGDRYSLGDASLDGAVFRLY